MQVGNLSPIRKLNPTNISILFYINVHSYNIFYEGTSSTTLNLRKTGIYVLQIHFFVLHIHFSVLHNHFFMLHIHFSVLHIHFFVLHIHFSVLQIYFYSLRKHFSMLVKGYILFFKVTYNVVRILYKNTPTPNVGKIRLTGTSFSVFYYISCLLFRFYLVICMPYST